MAGFPRRYVVFDTETTPCEVGGGNVDTDQSFRLGCALTVDPELSGSNEPMPIKFYDPQVFIDYLLNLPYHKDPIYVFAHNIGFDVRTVGLFRGLADDTFRLLPPADRPGAGRYKEPLFIPESPPFIVRLWRLDGQAILLLDTYQWWKVSLAQVGEWLGFPKGTMPRYDEPDSVWYDYCMRDVEVTLAGLKRTWSFLRIRNIRDFHVTPATQASMLWKQKWEKKRIRRPESDESMRFERLAYYGGMVDCFRTGRIEGPVTQVDVSAMYPYVMSHNLFPHEVSEHNDIPQRTKPWTDIAPRTMTAEVFLESPNTPYPVRCADGTLWVTGKVRTILCGPELQVAWENGHIRFIGRHTIYHLTDLFTGFMNQWWRLRQEAKRNGNMLEEYLCKVLMNSLHGKFGQKAGDWQYVGREMPNAYYGSGKVVGKSAHTDVQWRCLAGHCYHRATDAEDSKGFVPIASWTSSYARVFMDEQRAVVGDRHCYYQATDSLLVDTAGLCSLNDAGVLDTGRMGDFRSEGSYECVNVHGVNMLDLGTTRKRSGVRKTALIVGQEVYEQDEWESFADAIFRGNPSSTGIKKILKRIRLGYKRREVLADGWTVPWRIDNWDVPPEKQRDLKLALGHQSGP